MARKSRGRLGYKQFSGDDAYKRGFAQYLERDKPKSRIDILKERIKNFSDPDDYMLEILSVFNETEIIPEPGKYYTFVYIAKTPEILYDQHPLIACTSIQRWGFTGLNFHFPMMRNYTWEEVIGQMHIINNNEIQYMKTVPYKKMLINN